MSVDKDKTMTTFNPVNTHRKIGWLDPLLSALLPYVIWFPYQVYSAVTGFGWKSLAKQLSLGSLSLDSKSSQLSPNLGAPPRPVPTSGSGVELLLGKTEFQDPGQPRRLTLLYTWLTAKPQHAQKYSKIFTDRGIDVLKVQISPMDLMQPTSRSQVIAQQVADFLLHNHQFDKILVYGFSVGAYAFCEVIKKIRDNPEKYSNVEQRLVGHVWDSPVDLPNMPIGIAITITNGAKLQRFITKSVEWFLKVRYDAATRHYEASAHHMHKGPVNAPGLYIYSLDDPMSPDSINQTIIGKWKKAGMEVTTKKFDRAPHCASFSSHSTEYRSTLASYLQQVAFMDQTELKMSLQA